MLQHQAEPIAWKEEWNKALDFLPNELKQYTNKQDFSVEELHFPVLQYPEKVSSLNLKKTPLFVGKLMGIKGQYLLFEDQTVFNIRSNEGERVKILIN
jgi:hypothetical protein